MSAQTDPEREIVINVNRDKEFVFVDFEQPIEYLKLHPLGAIRLAELMKKKAEEVLASDV